MISEPRRSASSIAYDFVASPIIGLSAAALFWSGNFVVGRALRNTISPLSLNFWRWTIALAILLPLTYGLLKRHRLLILRHWKLIAFLGLTGIASFHTCVYLALTTTSAVNALLLLSLAPLLIVLVSWSVLGERVSLLQLLGITVSFVGATALIAHGSVSSLTALRFGTGDLWMLLAVVLWALYSLLLKRVPAELPQLALLSASTAVAVLLMLPVYLLAPSNEQLSSLDRQTLWAILYIALFASVLAFLLWNHGVSKIGPSKAGTFIYLMPVFGAVLAFAFLGEGLQVYQLGGGALIFLGIAVMNRKRALP
jgi:drug/metabolite transporter (DMT)-like permease